MNIIICIDNNDGMLFNNRRQSRDKYILYDIKKDIQNKKLKICNFSQALFQNSNIDFDIDENFISNADINDTCFVENKKLAPFIDTIDSITVYRWNRIYPSDFKLDISLDIFELSYSTEFKGYSHDKITKEVYFNVKK